MGVADHLGWAVLVTAGADHLVVDRRRVALVDEALSAAPIHYDRGESTDAEIVALVAAVRRSIARLVTAAFDELEVATGPIGSVVLRAWPELPAEMAVLRRAPWEARADAVMYRQALAEVAVGRGWAVELYDAKWVEARAAEHLGARARDVLHGPRATLGPPWAKDHRTALAATVVASSAAREVGS